MEWSAQGESQFPYLTFLSFDKLKYAFGIHKALRWVTDYDVKASFFCYLLFNFTDSGQRIFGNRIQIAQKIVDDVGETIYLFPQRYEPLNALERNQYIGKHWNADLVRGVTRLYTLKSTDSSRSPEAEISMNGSVILSKQFMENALRMATDENFKLQKKPLIRSDEWCRSKIPSRCWHISDDGDRWNLKV